MIRAFSLPTLTANGAGAGTVVSVAPLTGRVAGAYFNYSGTATPTITLTSVAPPGTVLSAIAPSGWFYPTVALHSGQGIVVDAYAWPPIDGYARLVMSGAGSAETMGVTLLVEQ